MGLDGRGMYFEQFYLGCLAHASYLIGSDGEAAVVDPRRDVDDYLRVAKEHDLRIRYVVETHLHADFVSGHRELAERTGARIVFGRQARAQVPHLAVGDGDEVRVGKVVLRFLETPGHTPESISVLVIDTEASPTPRLVLTGDTLFVGDGRSCPCPTRWRSIPRTGRARSAAGTSRARPPPRSEPSDGGTGRCSR